LLISRQKLSSLTMSKDFTRKGSPDRVKCTKIPLLRAWACLKRSQDADLNI
jgi:hypothetical protein